MEKFIFIAIILVASIYVIVRIYYRIKIMINLSKGKTEDSCGECGSCAEECLNRRLS